MVSYQVTIIGVIVEKLVDKILFVTIYLISLFKLNIDSIINIDVNLCKSSKRNVAQWYITI